MNESTLAGTAILEQGVEAILSQDGFRAYLQTMARFHNYSYANTIMILVQRPEATQVAGFYAWQTKFKRRVKRGAKAIRIWAPNMVWVREEDESGTVTRRKKLVGFNIVNVFAYEDTEGEPLPEAPEITVKGLTGAQGWWKLLPLVEPVCTAERIQVRFQSDTGRAEGYYRPVHVWPDGEQGSLIVINNRHQYTDQGIKTWVHELAHHVAGHRSYAETAREDAETVAEGASFVVCHHFGLDTSDYSFGYVAGWARDTAVFKRNLNALQKVAHDVITRMEGAAAPATEEAAA